jgi:isopenicillin N synthase-like dioxygenase
MQCHYYPPCPEPERVMGSREHTDGDFFTVLAQDGVGGLQVRLDDGEWVDVAPVPGALLVNIGDVLKV